MRYRKLADLIKDAETSALDPNDPVRLRQELDAPVRSAGKWKLSSKHEVSYCERHGGDKEATIKGSLVAAEPDALVISVTTKEDEKRTVTGLVKLSGKWELDEKNRITFSVKRGLDRYDKLTFQGAWEINDNFQVTYSVNAKQVLEGSKKHRRRVTQVTQALIFEGHWNLSEKNGLTYLIGVDSASSFRFRGTFGTPSILAKKGEIRYQVVPIPINWSEAEIGVTLATVNKKKTKASVGIEYKTSRGAKKRITQTIVLFGKWKLSDDHALSFEIEHADGRRSEIRVGTEFDLTKLQEKLPLLPDEISVDLVSRTGKPLGIELVLTKDLFDGDAQTFVRLRKSLRETAVEAGIKISW